MNAVECLHVSKPYPAHLLEASRDLLGVILGGIPAQVAPFATTMMRRYPRHADQAEEVAADFGVSPRDAFLANLSYDLAVTFGCSTVAAATDDGPVLFRNMDWFNEREIARASCVVPTEGGASAGFVGSVGVVSGLSRNGFALALNAVGSPPGDLGGYPVLLFLRKVLDEAADFAEAVRMLATEKLLAGGLVTVVGRENGQRAVVERTREEAHVRRPRSDEPLTTTNHFQGFAADDGTCGRLACLRRAAPKLSRRPTDEEMLYLLTDPEVRQEITAQHVVARPAAGTLRMYVPRDLVSSEW